MSGSQLAQERLGVPVSRLNRLSGVRVGTWNMNYWQRKPEGRAAAWDLVRDLRLDVALLQEAVPPPGAEAVYRAGGIDEHRPWGSAVVSFGGKLVALESVRSAFKKQDMDLLRTLPGSVAIGQLVGGESIVFVSVYGLLDGGYAITTMHRILSDLTPLLDSPELGKRIVVGGDLNCSTQLSGVDRARHRNLFDRFATLGLIDLLALTAGSRPALEDAFVKIVRADMCRPIDTPGAASRGTTTICSRLRSLLTV